MPLPLTPRGHLTCACAWVVFQRFSNTSDSGKRASVMRANDGDARAISTPAGLFHVFSVVVTVVTFLLYLSSAVVASHRGKAVQLHCLFLTLHCLYVKNCTLTGVTYQAVGTFEGSLKGSDGNSVLNTRLRLMH